MDNAFEYAPLDASFTIVSIIGIIVSALGILPYGSTYPALKSWGFTFLLFFLIMFLASFISMTKSKPLPHHMETLAVHENDAKKRSDE